jgi:hypothetical protein
MADDLINWVQARGLGKPFDSYVNALTNQAALEKPQKDHASAGIEHSQHVAAEKHV